MLTSPKFATVTLVVMGSFTACSGQVASSEGTIEAGGTTGGNLATGGASGQVDPSIATGCDGSVCCVPLAVSAPDIRVYKQNANTMVTVGVQRVATANPDYAWSASARVTTSFGGSQDCRISTRSHDTQTAAIDCPVVDSDLQCGSNITVQIQLQASGFTSQSDSTPACDSGLGMTLTYTVPVECPACPSSPYEENFKPCDMPVGAACSYPSMTYGGQFIQAPCTCTADSTEGRIWRCAVA
jgi:hypothetical protein